MLAKSLLTNSLAVILIFSTLTQQVARKSKQSFLDIPVLREFFCNFSSEMQEMMYENSSCKLTKVDRKVNAININILLKEPVNVICVSFEKFPEAVWAEFFFFGSEIGFKKV